MRTYQTADLAFAAATSYGTCMWVPALLVTLVNVPVSTAFWIAWPIAVALTVLVRPR